MKPRKPSSRRPRPSKKKLIGVEVPEATPKQLAALKKVFKSKAVTSLGIEPSAVITRQQLAMKRKRRR